MKKSINSFIKYTGCIIFILLGTSSIIIPQEKVDSNITIAKAVSGSGGILNSLSNNYVHSGTAGEVIVGGMNSSKYFMHSGFWVPLFIEPTEVTESTINRTPTKFQLNQNYPNPFNPTTTIEYEIPENSIVTIDIYNMAGQRIRHLIRSRIEYPGFKKITWDGYNDNGSIVASGTYLYHVAIINSQTNTQNKQILFQQTKKMLFVK